MANKIIKMPNKFIRSKRLYENQLSYGDITSVSGLFEFNDGSHNTISNASKDAIYGKLIQAIFQAQNTNNMLIIRDEEVKENFITSLDYNDNEIQGTAYSIMKNTSDDNYAIRIVVLTYKKDIDELTISCESNTLLPNAEAPKMYRHNLVISHKRTAYDDNQHDIFLTYYSSNNLEANTPEKLTTLTKATNGTNLRAPVYSITSAGSSDYDKISLYYIGAVYDGSAWNIMNTNGSSSSIVINRVTDTVEEA